MTRKWWTLLTVCLGILMLLLDITIVNVALPSIASDLGASFSDLLGHRALFAAGLAVFSISSLVCGLASDPLVLNLSRAVQGVGGAAMFATSLALIAQEFRGRERGTALGIWGATAGASIAIGPLIGGGAPPRVQLGGGFFC